jgi:hypothetical protein
MQVSELDRLIEHRARQARQNGERERPEEAPWKASVRRYNAAQDAERRAEWCDFHRLQAERHRRTLEDLARYHEAQAASLQATKQKEEA